MDLSFTGFDRNTEVRRLPGDLAVLMIGIAARQTASPTALAQARFGRIAAHGTLLQPLDGAFNGPMALRLAHWAAGPATGAFATDGPERTPDGG